MRTRKSPAYLVDVRARVCTCVKAFLLRCNHRVISSTVAHIPTRVFQFEVTRRLSRETAGSGLLFHLPPPLSPCRDFKVLTFGTSLLSFLKWDLTGTFFYSWRLWGLRLLFFLGPLVRFASRLFERFFSAIAAKMRSTLVYSRLRASFIDTSDLVGTVFFILCHLG